jgi:hypothetical protein
MITLRKYYLGNDQLLAFFGFSARVALVCLPGMRQPMTYDQDDLDRLLKTNSCSSYDLTEADLCKANLFGGGSDSGLPDHGLPIRGQACPG